MGFPTKVQLIQRKDSQQWYINFPSAVARAMEFSRGEVVEWIVEDKNRLLLRGLLAAAHFPAGAHLGPFRPDLFGPSHAVRLALHCGATVRRLVGRVSFV
jgi:hypothetical protein